MVASIKGIAIAVADYRSKEREIHSLLVGQKGYNSDFYCGASGIDIETIDGKAIIPYVDVFEQFLSSKGVVFENLKVELKENEL